MSSTTTSTCRAGNCAATSARWSRPAPEPPARLGWNPDGWQKATKNCGEPQACPAAGARKAPSYSAEPYLDRDDSRTHRGQPNGVPHRLRTGDIRPRAPLHRTRPWSGWDPRRFPQVPIEGGGSRVRTGGRGRSRRKTRRWLPSHEFRRPLRPAPSRREWRRLPLLPTGWTFPGTE